MRGTIQQKIEKLKWRMKSDQATIEHFEKILGRKEKKEYLPPVRFTQQRCRKCGGALEVRSHQQITEKQLKKSYYFAKWLFCKNCNAVFFDEKDKVFKNGKPMSPFYGYGKKDSWTPPPANWREIALAKERGLTT